MKAPVIAIAFAAVLGAGPSACALAGYAPLRDTVPALESMLLEMVECVPSIRNPAPASNAAAIVDSYLRIHAAVRADATIGLHDRGMTVSSAAAPASACTGEETSVPQDRWPAPDARA